MDPNRAELLDYYVYNFEILALAPGDIDSDVQQVETESNFVWTKTSGFASVANAAQNYDTRVVPLVTLQVTDVGSGRSLFSGPAAWSSVVAWGEIPYILPLKRRWQGGTSMRIDVVNFDAVLTYDLRLSFSGYKDFGSVRVR